MDKWIDTHSHYDSKRINNSELIHDMFMTNNKIITLGTSTKTNAETLRLISLHKNLYGMIGFYPNNACELEEDFVGQQSAIDNWLIFTYEKLIL